MAARKPSWLDFGPRIARDGARVRAWPLLLLLSACSGPVARHLNDAEANRIVVALDRSGVFSTKENDPQSEGLWQVAVPSTDVPYALSILSDLGLPSKERPGVADSRSSSELVPSLQTEQARLLAGVAGDLERTLGQLEGVVSARVHIAVPPLDPLVADEALPPASASVLIRHNSKSLQISNESLQRLVAGAVPRLSPGQVSVVSVATGVEPARARKLVSLGPFAVAKGSVWGLRCLVGGIALLNLLLLAQLLVFWRKIRLFRASQAESPAPAARNSPA